jgi:apolipoprotein N-acyltransferase
MSFVRSQKLREESVLMAPRLRLFWCGVTIFGSLLYGILISINPRVASAIMLGYIAALLTIVVVVDIWKKPHDR